MTCDQCGLCCLHYHGTYWARTSDLLRWHDEGRKDILQYVAVSGPDGSRTTAIMLPRTELEKIEHVSAWTDPESGREILPCPFLRKVSTNRYLCSIHATKSQTCRRFVHEDWEMFIAYRERFFSP
ncbi:MAG: YkgJ family cysteine cluster protein [Methanomicrobiales archaeon]|nr:YkgJ family cysteine cluster protein [Methanomicrobiales archaeon]